MKKLLLISVLMLFCVSCEKYEREPDEEEFIPIGEEGRQWFKGLPGRVNFRSNTGLTDSYTIGSDYHDKRVRVEGKMNTYAEAQKYYYSSDLNGYQFFIGIRSSEKEDGITFEYHTYIKSYFSFMVFTIGLKSYKPIYIFRDPLDTPTVNVSSLRSIADTAIGGTEYTDLYSVSIDHKYMDTSAINSLFISKSKGLVAFTVQKNIIWYRNE